MSTVSLLVWCGAMRGFGSCVYVYKLIWMIFNTMRKQASEMKNTAIDCLNMVEFVVSTLCIWGDHQWHDDDSKWNTNNSVDFIDAFPPIGSSTDSWLGDSKASINSTEREHSCVCVSEMLENCLIFLVISFGSKFDWSGLHIINLCGTVQCNAVGMHVPYGWCVCCMFNYVPFLFHAIMFMMML